MCFWMGFNLDFELCMKEYWVPGEHRQILNIGRLCPNMQNTKFKEFASFKAQGTNLKFGWGSIQEWGCIQVDTVSV